MGKFPHEFETCTEEELAFLYSAVIEIYGVKE